LDPLASLDLTGCCLAGIIGWLALGAYAANLPFFRKGLSGMDAVLVRDWLINEAARHPWVLAWLLVLLLLAAILGINLAACLWLRLVRTTAESRGLRFWFF
jgi:hypothetical protein